MFIKDSIDNIAKPLVKDDKAIENIKKAAFIAQKSIDLAFSFCKSGTRASKIDKEVEKYIKSQNGYPANFEVSGYGFATSVSIGNEIAHGIPSKKKYSLMANPSA